MQPLTKEQKIAAIRAKQLTNIQQSVNNSSQNVALPKWAQFVPQNHDPFKGIDSKGLDKNKVLERAQDFDSRSAYDKSVIVNNIKQGKDPYIGIEGPKNDTPILGFFGSAFGNIGRSVDSTPVVGDVKNAALNTANAVGAFTGSVLANTLPGYAQIKDIQRGAGMPVYDSNPIKDTINQVQYDTSQGQQGKSMGFGEQANLPEGIVRNAGNIVGGFVSLDPIFGAYGAVRGVKAIANVGKDVSKVSKVEKATSTVAKDTSKFAEFSPEKVIQPVDSKFPEFDIRNSKPTTTTEMTGSSKKVEDAMKFNEAIDLGFNAQKLNTVKPMQKVNPGKLFTQRISSVLEGMGTGGKSLSYAIKKSRDDAEIANAAWVKQMPTLKTLSKEEMPYFVQAVETGARTGIPKVDQAISEWKQVSSQVYNTAKQAGIDLGQRENYFPHMFDPKTFSDKNRYAELVNNIVAKGYAPDVVTAQQMLRDAQDVIRNRKYGNLEYQRLFDLPGYRMDKDAIYEYLTSASNRIAEVNNLGIGDNIALRYIAQIANEGYDASSARKLMDRATGAEKFGEYASKTSQFLRSLQSITKLGLGAISNVTQSLNVATVTGFGNTVKAIAKQFANKADRDFVQVTGTVLQNVLNDLKQGQGFLEGVIGKVSAPFFNQVEGFNRSVAAIAGRDYGMLLAKRAAEGDKRAISGLQKLGLDGESIARRGTLTDVEKISAARNIVERTQFKLDPIDLPYWSSSPLGKLVSQFRTFSYNQSAFMVREVFQPLAKGDVRPLATFVLVGIPLGMTTQQITNLLRARSDDNGITDSMIRGAQRVGTFGLAGDLYTGIVPQSAGYTPPERQATRMMGAVLGPTFGAASDLATSAYSASQGKPFLLERYAVKNIPLVGPTLANVVTPYSAASTINGSATETKSTPTTLTRTQKIAAIRSKKRKTTKPKARKKLFS